MHPHIYFEDKIQKPGNDKIILNFRVDFRNALAFLKLYLKDILQIFNNSSNLH